MDTLLNHISANCNNTIITDKWSNDKIGEIVDLQNNYTYQFVAYKTIDGTLYESYKNEEEKIKLCPVVATSIVGYWIKYHSTMSTVDLFANYYIHTLNLFELQNRENPKLIGKDLKWIFLQYAHLRKERKLIQISNNIFSYITEKDINIIQSIITEYKSYVLHKCLDYILRKSAVCHPEEERYTIFYKQFNMACMVASWIEDEYDLGYFPKKNNAKIAKEHIELHNNIEPQEAADWIEIFNGDMPSLIDSPLMKEIYNRLEKCEDKESLWRTAQDLILPFKDFAQHFDHSAEIKDKEQELSMYNEQKRHGVYSLNDEQEEALTKRIESIKTCIDRLKHRGQKFYDIVQDAIKEPTMQQETASMEFCLFIYWSSMVSYARRLAAILLRFGINIIDVQKTCGVYLVWDMPLHNYIDGIYVSNITHAKELFRKINKTNEQMENNKNVFIVHGHDDGAIAKVSYFLSKIGYNPIVLKEQPNGGKTIIEKIELCTNVCFAIVLYTPCDLGKDKNFDDSAIRPRARQNVIFEHGYLCSKLGRERVCALVTDANIEIPGDLSGILYQSMDTDGIWEIKIAKEMKSCNLPVDLNRI